MNLTHLAAAVTCIVVALYLLTGHSMNLILVGILLILTGILFGLNAFGVSTTVPLPRG